ncbi:MAG: hypothetical protein AAGF56_05090 [Pseudomonadota bacterium]
MTALDKYVRLESGALWRQSPDDQRREVVVSFGDATLVIADTAGRPLTHWSLPALIRQNPDTLPAVYTPDSDDSEEVEIEDATMVDAIEEVRNALARARPTPGKLRHWLMAGVVAVTAALAVFWLPGALLQQTLAVVPDAKRQSFGQIMLARIEAQTGSVCDVAATDGLVARLFGPDSAARIAIVPRLPALVIGLPGQIYVLDQGVMRQADDPAVAAGLVLAASTAQREADPLQELLTTAGLRTTFRLLTTGDIPVPILQDHARNLLTTSPPAPDTTRLQAAFDAAEIPGAPYAKAIDAITGSMPQLADVPDTGAMPVVLSDSDWVALQNACT